jgi:hypothetical protein
MRQTHTGCYGCKYNYDRQCTKDGVCTGVEPHENWVPITSEPVYIPTNTTTLPDEIEINGVKYRRVKE